MPRQALACNCAPPAPVEQVNSLAMMHSLTSVATCHEGDDPPLRTPGFCPSRRSRNRPDGRTLHAVLPRICRASSPNGWPALHGLPVVPTPRSLTIEETDNPSAITSSQRQLHPDVSPRSYALPARNINVALEPPQPVWEVTPLTRFRRPNHGNRDRQ